MLVLGIETSCDETSVGIIEDDKILSNLIYSQIEHKDFGGVVPEIASRAHLKKVVPLLRESLKNLKLKIEDFDLITATAGPGLIGALIVGFCFSKSLAYANNKLFIPVNHLHGHLYSVFLSDTKPSFPNLTLIVSGGHTSLYLIKDFYQMELVGNTRDDAAGEAFDKVGKLLGMQYPAGPQIQKAAESGDENFFKFPVAQLNDTFDFSFSGIKTSVLRFIEREYNFNLDEKAISNIAASFQKSVVEILVKKLKVAADYYKVKSVSVVGGVAANSQLKKRALETFSDTNILVFIPELSLCSDNGAMIAYAGLKSYETGYYLKSDIKEPFPN